MLATLLELFHPCLSIVKQGNDICERQVECAIISLYENFIHLDL